MSLNIKMPFTNGHSDLNGYSMSLSYVVYRQLTNILFLILFPLIRLYTRLSGRYIDSIDQRLGVYSQALKRRFVGVPKICPRIWVHAASVGEVSVASTIIEELIRLRPEIMVVVSTTTETGQTFAEDKFPKSVVLLYAPADSTFSVKRALSVVQPDVLVCIETEIWPNWFVEAHKMGIKTLLVNGRISVRSVKRYLKIKSLFRPVLKTVRAFSMIHEEDAQRILMMGAPKHRVFVNGNAKFDGMDRNHRNSNVEDIRKIYSLKGNETIFVAGSTRRDEEEIVLDAYGKILEIFPKTLLFIAPRHIERAKHVGEMIKTRGFEFQLRTEIDSIQAERNTPVIIMDTIGELATVYGVCTVAFCGGSLVPLGGQNILEAAVWGKPVLYGPFMEDFQEARTLVENVVGEAFLVRNMAELAQKTIHYIGNPSECRHVGQKARSAVMENLGAAKKHAKVIAEICPSLVPGRK